MDLAKLESSAADLLQLIDPNGHRAARLGRPFVVELTGPPKSGKSTTKLKLQQVLKRNGFQVAALEEGAEAIKWPKRLDPEYNLQTGEYVLSAVREMCYGSAHKNFHVVIADRGILDIVIRMEFNARRGKISPEEQRVIEQYALLEHNRRMFDAHVVLVADPGVALGRERDHALSVKEGESMNRSAQDEQIAAHRSAWERLGFGADPKMQWRDTSAESADQTAVGVFEFVLQRMRAYAPSAA